MTKKLGVAILGCGNIAEPYAETLATYPEIELIGMADLEVTRAEALAAKFGCRAYPSIEAMLADEAVELVVNLTIHHAHAATTTLCLEAGKHVHCEKPLALTYEEARVVVELARQKGLRLGCSPFTYMGEAQQTAWKIIREGKLGQIRVAFAEVNWGRIESWHPAPGPFYQVGALFDVAVYPLTMLTAFFGPARQVWAYGKVVHPDRVTREGIPFHIDTPDFVVAVIELENGPLVRLTSDFYVSRHSSKQDGIEFHGDLGTLYLQSWHDFNVAVEVAEFGQPLQPVALIRPAYEGKRKVEWGRAVRDMAQALAEDRPHRATGEQAAHVVEILNAVTQSIETSQPVAVRSSFTPPAPMVWALP
ncbi:MAG: gfo/Idh/MocA family oxidoreductase [Anaerolineae bacterium]|nr:Gfo/Idh/MocA family oxidoreductase [Anaerolineales bacterium]MCQ3976206.1 gfo/Idh/MocA family oxidoreductase [Anaerolineae bacterium]